MKRKQNGFLFETRKINKFIKQFISIIYQTQLVILKIFAVSTMCMDAKATPTNDIGYSYHRKAIEPIIWGYVYVCYCLIHHK